MLDYFCFLEQLLVIKMGSGAFFAMSSIFASDCTLSYLSCFQAALNTEDPQYHDKRMVSSCLEHAVLNQLATYFRETLSGYPTTLSEDEAMLADCDIDPKKRIATHLIRCEKKILSRCLQATVDLGKKEYMRSDNLTTNPCTLINSRGYTFSKKPGGTGYVCHTLSLNWGWLQESYYKCRMVWLGVGLYLEYRTRNDKENVNFMNHVYSHTGDTANKIRIYSLVLCAKHHDIMFYVAAPLTLVDLSLSCGDEIVIEERSAKELLNTMEVSRNKLHSK
ncbi:hypothetical protein L6452_22505 [Arctium lappa]|uniref:Uncharacterized protein n=1 Tax=Arctium lappa TaxID=4217 RepID=A0ACB9B009_ARCLA|nr:hypothetical protein L6452_22505 [Arctium lappa]